jgi:diacylglycerol kinase (ATP)
MTEDTANKQWAIIVNPHAGGKKAFQFWQKLSVALQQHTIPYEIAFTEGPFHAVQLAKKFRHQSFEKFLVIGGDGTLSEVVHGIFSCSIPPNPTITLSIVPIGTGNDWARYWGITPVIASVVQSLLNYKTQTIDIGQLSFVTYQGVPQTRYFINAMGEGFDAKVAKLTTYLGSIFKGKSWLYSLSVFIVPFVYRAKPIRLEFDNGLVVQKKIYTLSCGNGCYTGGGIKQTPDAVPTDGLFDVMMVESPSLWGIITGIHYLFKGKLLQHKLVQSTQTKEFTITSSFPLCIETDGISLPDTYQATVRLLPQAINFIIP